VEAAELRLTRAFRTEGAEVRHLIKSVVFSFSVLAASAAPGQRPTSSEPLPSRDAPIILAEQKFGEIAKVKVDRAGRIYLNGRIVTLENLKRELSRLHKVNGAVWYHRENPHQDPPPEALAVLQAIIDARLPVKLLEKDFD
jgi:hypothetical protein